MHLAILAAVLAALTQADDAGLPPVTGLPWRLLLAAGAMLTAPAAALVGVQRIARAMGNTEEESRSEARLSRLQSLVVMLWLGAVAVLLFVVQWPHIVRGNWSLAGWPLVDELAILAPVIAPLVLLWAALYRLERAGQIAVFRERGLEPPPARLFSYLWLHARQHLGLVLLPALVVIGGQELLVMTGAQAGSTSTALWFGLPLVLSVLLLMPVVVRRVWRTSPLPAGALRDELTSICQARRCKVGELLIWHTDGHVGNAAVVGLSRWLRYVLLTDGLLARLSTAQVAAVVRHELGHLRRRHLLLRLALLALPLAWWVAIEAAWPGTEHSAEHALAAVGVPPAVASMAIAPLAMLIYAVLIVGWYSRVLEHEADLEACCDDAGRFDADYANDFRQALVRLIGGSKESWISEWLHPGLDARLDFIRRAHDQPRFAERFCWKLRLIAAIVIAFYAGAALLPLV